MPPGGHRGVALHRKAAQEASPWTASAVSAVHPASRYLFVDRRRRAKVALLYSVPALMWRRFSSLLVGSTFDPSGVQCVPLLLPSIDRIDATGRGAEQLSTPFDQRRTRRRIVWTEAGELSFQCAEH